MTLCRLVLAQRVVTGGGDGPALMFPACSITLTFHCVLFQSCGDGDGRAGNRPNYCRVEMDQPFLRQIEPPDLAKVRYIWYPCAVLHIWSLWWFCLFRTSISGPERLCCPETWSFLKSTVIFRVFYSRLLWLHQKAGHAPSHQQTEWHR